MISKQYKKMVGSDLYRISKDSSFRSFLQVLMRDEGFVYCFWMRTCFFLYGSKLLKAILYPFAKLILAHYKYKFGISIPFSTQIGSGFYIGHYGGIVVNEKSVIGKNCNISHGVTLGQANRGKNKGYPVIYDNVYIGPGAKIVGNIQIGNNVAIGANCVVTRNIPDNAVVVGVPGEIISYKGSEGYVEHTDY